MLPPQKLPTMEDIMTIGQFMLSEFDEEMKNTRRVLERVPDDKWGWKPHEKSGTLGWLATHVGTVPEWITMTINTDELDYAPVNGPSWEPPKRRMKRSTSNDAMAVAN